jgi:hypothetical protein
MVIFLAISNVQAQLSIDAQYRNRFEVRDGYQKLAADGATPAVFISQRTRITFSYQTEGLRLKFTPQDVRVWGDEQLASSTGVFGDEASLDLFEAFAEIRTGRSGWLSVGRQQLVYDNERILAARNWNQSGIAYDAVVYKWEPEGWNFHLGSSWNSTGENTSDNFYDPDRIKSLSFLWIKRTLAEGWNLSLSHVASGVTKSETENTLYFRQTTGLYTTYKSGGWNLWANVYYQFGKNKSGNDVSASMIDAEASYKPGKLTTAAGIGYLSGNSKTGTEQTTDHLFDILYGARHRVYGSIDYFRSFDSHTKQGGLIDYYIYLDYKFSGKTSLRNTGHYFQLAKTNPDTPDDKKLGYENDLLLKHQFSGWGAFEAGYSFFLPTSSLKTIQGVEDHKFSQFLYLQLTITPSLFNSSKSL